LGLRPSHEFRAQANVSEDWARKWLVVKKIQMKKLQDSNPHMRLFEIEDI